MAAGDPPRHRDHGKGWQLVEQSGKFKLTHRHSDGAHPASPPWEWGSANRLKVLELIAAVQPLMLEKLMGLADAVKAKIGAIDPTGTDRKSSAATGIDWKEAFERWEKAMRKRGVGDRTWKTDYASAIRKIQSALGSSPTPRNGQQLMDAVMAITTPDKPGSNTRLRFARKLVALLNYVVDDAPR